MCCQLKALRGPFDVQMGERYAHLTAENLAPYADRLCALREVDEVSAGAYGTFTAPPSKEKGLHSRKPLIMWRARQDSNPRPLGS